MAEGVPAVPTLADQVSRLYDLVAGYHATHLVEIARELGVWEALAQRPGVTSAELAVRLGTQPFPTDVLCRTAFSFGLLDREGAGWRLGPHFDQILGDPDSSFYLACAPRVHMVVGEDYREYVDHFRAGTTKPYQDHGGYFMQEVAEALKTLPRIFLDHVLPRLPDLAVRLQDGGRVLDVGCGGGWAVVQIAERFPETHCVGIDVERDSIDLARRLIAQRGLKDRCEARVRSVDLLAEDGTYDVATSFLVVHEIPPGGEAAGVRCDCAGAQARRLLLDLRRGVPGDRRGTPHDADPLRCAGAVVRGHLGQRGRHPIRAARALPPGRTPDRRGDQLLPLRHHPRHQAAISPRSVDRSTNGPGRTSPWHRDG